jgi:hypothetical protein
MNDKDMLERLRRKDAGDDAEEREESFFSESLEKPRDFEEEQRVWRENESSRKVQYFSFGGGSCLGCLVVILILGALPFLLMGTFLWGVVLFAIIGIFGLLRWLF